MANTANLDLVKPAGTDHALVSVLNQNSDKIDAFAGKTNAAMASVQDGIAIVADGDTHAAIASGQFVYVKNHSTLAEGLYRATAAIATDAALSTSNLAADASGGMNALKSDIDTLNSKIANSIVRRQYSVALSENSVLDLTYYGQVDVSSDVNLYGNPIGIWCVGYGGAPYICNYYNGSIRVWAPVKRTEHQGTWVVYAVYYKP